jgi:UPF0042 nucleotide-binding protein
VTDSSTPVLVVTGLSGAGKTSALKVLEDLGYEAVDNLPLAYVPHLAGAADRAAPALAIGVDTRTRGFSADAFATQLNGLREHPDLEVRLLFLNSDDEVLRRRFSETRRRHPLAADRTVTDGIVRERGLMAPLIARADIVIDSSLLSVADLRGLLIRAFALEARPRLQLSLTSFAFRNGLPREADLVFDVRFLTNPHYHDELRERTGLDQAVAAFVAQDPHYERFFESLSAMLLLVLPLYAAEGRSYLTVAVGCTGGRHRSVMVAEALAARIGEAGFPVRLRHRDIG